MIKLGSKGTGVISALEPTTNKILKILDIEDRGIYQTRHTFASIRLTMGEKVEWVSYMLRHENINITLSKYYKYIKELDTKRVTLNFDLTHNQHTS